MTPPRDAAPPREEVQSREEVQPREEDPAPSDFFTRVWAVVAQIPPGRVTTYGHIAAYLGVKSAARTVGWALNAAPALGANPVAMPAHRVVNRQGALSGRLHFPTPSLMEDLLRSEGVAFTDDGRVMMAAHLWIPGTEEG